MANINFYFNFLFFPTIKSFIAAPKTLSLSLLTEHQVKMLLKKVKLSNKCSTITLGFFFFFLFLFNHKLACYWVAGLKMLLFLISLFETIPISNR